MAALPANIQTVLNVKPKEPAISFDTLGAHEVSVSHLPYEDEPTQGAVVAYGIINPDLMAHRQQARRANTSGDEFYPDVSDRSPSMLPNEIVFTDRGDGVHTDEGVYTCFNGQSTNASVAVVGVTDHGTRVEEGGMVNGSAAQDVAYQVGGRAMVYAGPEYCPVGSWLIACKPLIVKGVNGSSAVPSVIVGGNVSRFTAFVRPLKRMDWGGGFEENQIGYMMGSFLPDINVNPAMHDCQIILNATTALHMLDAKVNFAKEAKEVVRIAASRMKNTIRWDADFEKEFQDITTSLRKQAPGITAEAMHTMVISQWGFLKQAAIQDRMHDELRSRIVGQATTPGQNCVIGVRVQVGGGR